MSLTSIALALNRATMLFKSFLLSCILLADLTLCGRVKRQLIDTKQVIDIVCSACDKARIAEKPPPICCRCIDRLATCNNEIASGGNRNGERRRNQVSTGLTCPDDIHCQLFGASCPGNKYH